MNLYFCSQQYLEKIECNSMRIEMLTSAGIEIFNLLQQDPQIFPPKLKQTDKKGNSKISLINNWSASIIGIHVQFAKNPKTLKLSV